MVKGQPLYTVKVLADADAAKAKAEIEVVSFIAVDSEKTKEPKFHKPEVIVLFIAGNSGGCVFLADNELPAQIRS